MIEIHHIEDFAVTEVRNRTPIAYAQEKLQFTKNITRPATFEAPKNITIRPLMTFQQDRNQQIHQFQGVYIQPNSWSLHIKDVSTPILAGIQQQIDNGD